jgi:hypothetical protein
MPRIAFDPETPVADEADRACSVLAQLVGEPTIGRTPPVPQGWLLIEDNGPWGSKSAVRNPRLPGPLQEALIARKMRTQLIRRHRPPRGAPVRTLMVAWTGRGCSWLETVETDDPVALATTVDLDAVAAGRRPHIGELATEPVVLVCTQGGVDPCCAKFGRPVAAGLAEAYGPLVWEASHVGLCRFATNIVCLPSGVVYGRTDPRLAVRQVAELLAGRIVPDGLRGQAGVPRAVQVAELAVRHHVDRWELDALTLLDHREAGGEHRVTLAAVGRTFDVTLAELPGTARAKGCGVGDLVTYDELRVLGVSEHSIPRPYG